MRARETRRATLGVSVKHSSICLAVALTGVEAHPSSLLSPGTGRSSFPNSWVATSRSFPLAWRFASQRSDAKPNLPSIPASFPHLRLFARTHRAEEQEAGMGGTQKRRVGAPRWSSRGKDAPRGRRLHLRFLPGASLIYLAERRFLKPSAQGRREKKILPSEASAPGSRCEMWKEDELLRVRRLGATADGQGAEERASQRASSALACK